MINRSTYVKITKLILFLIIAYLVYFFISVTLSRHKLITVEENSKHKLSSILNIKENRITYESVLEKEKEFVGIRGMIDSLYYFSLIKIGERSIIKNLEEMIVVRNKDIPLRNQWLNYDVTSPDQLSLDQNFMPYLNVSIIPLNKIKKIDIYVKGKIILDDKINNNLIEYSIDAPFISFSFNDMDKSDFRYVSFYHSKSSIIFIKDNSDNLYIMNLAPIGERIGTAYKLKAPYKSLKELLKE